MSYGSVLRRRFASRTSTTTVLPSSTNQARGLGEFACAWVGRGGGGDDGPSAAVKARTVAFFVDSIVAGASALALQTNAPTLLRSEAIEDFAVAQSSSVGCTVLGSHGAVPFLVRPEKAIVANVSAVREWDTNGTVFGFNPDLPGHDKGEFGHNDFYPVAVAAAQVGGLDGRQALSGMMLIDEIRGRLCESFSLKSHKIDHVVHGAIASAATYGAMLGATPAQIESAIGMFVAHHVPWRAIRAGKQLSDSKGASAAISTEAAIVCVQRSMKGFIGPADIFRNPEALFRQFEPTLDDDATGAPRSPFDLVLTHAGEDFAVMGMHFKLGIYEHQSAGAIQAILNLLRKGGDDNSSGRNTILKDPVSAIQKIIVTAYEPAFGIIGDPAKRDPRTRQSADHSMVFILARLLVRAHQAYVTGCIGHDDSASEETWWEKTMLMPEDYGQAALACQMTRALMDKIEFQHDKSYDDFYPDGIPTSVRIETAVDAASTLDSGLVMHPGGHARCETLDENRILQYKAKKFAAIGVEGGLDEAERVISRLQSIEDLTPEEMMGLFDFELAKGPPIDG